MSGLSRSQISTHYSFIKGRIGEALTERLFKELGYSIHRYGVEYTLPGLTPQITNQKCTVSDSIRHMPDFVVRSNSGKLFYVEVKYRSDLKGNFDMFLQYEHAETLFIVVEPNSIGSITKKEVQQQKDLGFKKISQIAPLSESLAFSFTAAEKKVIAQFTIFAEAFFKDLPSFDDLCEKASEYVNTDCVS